MSNQMNSQDQISMYTPGKQIDHLLPEQKERFKEFIDKWIKIGLSTSRADKPRAEQAIKNLYKLAKLDEPKIIWLDDPIQGVRYAKQYAKENNALVKEAGYSYISGSLWAGYAAWADYFNIVCGVPIDRNYLDLVETCGYYWCLKGLVVMTDKPIKINLDEAGRLHSFTEMSISYSTGWGLYHIHGVRVPEFVVKAPHTITPEIIDKEKNIEVRRVMLQIYGEERYLLTQKFEVLDEDIDQYGRPRRLLRAQNGEDEPIVKVEVINSSPEPIEDSSYYQNLYRKFYLGVDFELRPLFPGLRGTALEEAIKKAEDMSREERIRAGYLGQKQIFNCHNAVASTLGRLGKDYGLPGQTRQGDVFIQMKTGKDVNRPFRES